MERDNLDLKLAAAAVVAAPEAAAAAVVAASEDAAASDAAAALTTASEDAAASDAAAALITASKSKGAATAASSDDDEGESALELLAEMVEKTKTLKLTEQTDAAAADASVENKDESAKSKVPVPASLVVAQTTTRKTKKLLVLNINGLLADINQDFHNAHLSHGRFRGKLVFKRPFCDDFLQFCFRNFEVGVWSSRLRHNVDAEVDIVMEQFKHRLLFCWDQSKCTATGLYTLENKNKELVLKELKNLWNNLQGEFSPSNTLLLDDSPYKALRNPPHTAIFPYPYSYKNRKHDSSLGPGGDVRLYLERLATADDIPRFVREDPFGQPAITESHPKWNFYKRVLLK